MKIHVKLLYAALLVFISAAGISLYSTETKAANAAINQLPAAGAIAGTDIIPITQGGSPVLARQAPMSAVGTYITISKAALPTTLTGFTSVNSPILATDTILQAFGKAQGQISGLVTGVSSVFSRTGAVIAVSGDYTAAQVTNAADKSSVTKQSFTAGLSGVDFTATGNTGAVSTTRYAGGTASGAPVAGTFSVGDYVVALNGSIWVCTTSGTPGTWVAVGSRDNLVPSVFGRTGAIVATSGDYSTNLVTENTNLYFTTPRVRATDLTGLSITNSAITSADTVLSAFGKAQGQINAMVSGVSSVFGRTGAVTAGTGDYTAAQVTNSADKSSSSTQTFSAKIIASADGATPNQLVAAGKTNPNQQVLFGYDTINDAGYMQAVLQGTATKNLLLQPSGNSLGVGYPTTHTFTKLFEVSGTALFAGAVSINGGMTVASAGGGIQFNDVGNMDINDGISFYSGNQYYRSGFENFGGTRGWIRQNVDAADSIHGYVWSAGTIPNSNYVMHLDGAGTWVLGANAHTASKQSLANVYGDLFLGNVSLPATPTVGGKLYSRLVSGDSNLFYLDSGGTEHQLTNGALTGYWSRSGTQLSPSTAGDSILTSSFVELTQSSTPATPTGASRIFSKSDGNVYVLSPTSSGLEKPITSVNKRTSTAVDSNGPADDLIFLDSTSGANLFVVDMSLIRRPLIITWIDGSNVPAVQAAAGQTINGISTPITLGTKYTSMTIVPISGTVGVIVATATG